MTSRTGIPTDPTQQSPIRRNLLDLYDVLSHKIAGGQRKDHRQLLPGAEDPAEGLVPDDYRPEVTDLADWFQPNEWAGLTPDDVPRADLATIPQPGTGGVEGDGLDFFRSGEAPNNYENRHNPLYEARRDFAVQIHDRIGEMFDVEGGGIGWLRPPSPSDAAPGGRSPNSDHQSGGAGDYYGAPEELDRLRNWLIQQPFVSFVRWRSESHGGASGTEEGAHLHVSYDIGWVAQNFFQGREIPQVSGAGGGSPAQPSGGGHPAATTAPGSSREPREAHTPVSGAGRPI